MFKALYQATVWWLLTLSENMRDGSTSLHHFDVWNDRALVLGRLADATL